MYACPGWIYEAGISVFIRAVKYDSCTVQSHSVISKYSFSFTMIIDKERVRKRSKFFNFSGSGQTEEKHMVGVIRGWRDGEERRKGGWESSWWTKHTWGPINIFLLKIAVRTYSNCFPHVNSFLQLEAATITTCSLRNCQQNSISTAQNLVKVQNDF